MTGLLNKQYLKPRISNLQVAIKILNIVIRIVHWTGIKTGLLHYITHKNNQNYQALINRSKMCN